MGNKKIIWVVSFCMILLLSCKGPLQPVYDEGNPDPNPTGGQAATITSINPWCRFELQGERDDCGLALQLCKFLTLRCCAYILL